MPSLFLNGTRLHSIGLVVHGMVVYSAHCLTGWTQYTITAIQTMRTSYILHIPLLIGKSHSGGTWVSQDKFNNYHGRMVPLLGVHSGHYLENGVRFMLIVGRSGFAVMLTYSAIV